MRGFGRDRAEAFEQAALALTGVLADPAAVLGTEEVEIACEAPDDDLLLAEWLNALVREMATRRMIFGRFAVRIDAARRHRRMEVKRATPATLRVARHEDGWMAQAVLDV